MKIEIKCRFTGYILFTHDSEQNSIKVTLEAAVKARANLDGANLDGANLAGANLYGANLDGANLAGANLYGANLVGANLAGANLYGANLYGANLYGANLDGETITKAPLSLLNLRWSVLVTGQYMRIGCKRHTHEEWAAFDDATIAEMSDGALEFWQQWKSPLLAICKQYHEAPASMENKEAA